MKSTEMRYAVGIDFGGTSVKLALINERGQIKARRKFVTKDVQGHAGWLARVAQEVEALKAGEGTGIALAGVGVGVPGFVDFERGFIHDLPNVPGWTGVSIGPRYSRTSTGTDRGCVR